MKKFFFALLCSVLFIALPMQSKAQTPILQDIEFAGKIYPKNDFSFQVVATTSMEDIKLDFALLDNVTGKKAVSFFKVNVPRTGLFDITDQALYNTWIGGLNYQKDLMRKANSISSYQTAQQDYLTLLNAPSGISQLVVQDFILADISALPGSSGLPNYAVNILTWYEGGAYLWLYSGGYITV
jgi:hypothetical protein